MLIRAEKPQRLLLAALLIGLTVAAVLMTVSGGSGRVLSAWLAPGTILSAELEAYQPVPPHPALPPHWVVGRLLEALRHNHQPVPSAGVKTLWTYSAPHLQGGDAGLLGLIEMFRSPAYAPLTRAVTFRILGQRQEGDHYECLVAVWMPGWPVDRPVLYGLLLGRQVDGPLAGCWLIEGVTPAPRSPLPGGGPLPGPERPRVPPDTRPETLIPPARSMPI